MFEDTFINALIALVIIICALAIWEVFRTPEHNRRECERSAQIMQVEYKYDSDFDRCFIKINGKYAPFSLNSDNQYENVTPAIMPIIMPH